MTPDELRALGHEPKSPLEALRERCIDCCAGSATEVKLCTAKRCPSWPFRLGVNPWRKPLSEEQRQARATSIAKARASRKAPVPV